MWKRLLIGLKTIIFDSVKNVTQRASWPITSVIYKQLPSQQTKQAKAGVDQVTPAIYMFKMNKALTLEDYHSVTMIYNF